MTLPRTLLLLMTTAMQATLAASTSSPLTSQLFPVPQDIEITNPTATRSLSNIFTISTATKQPDDVLVSALQRYTSFIPMTKEPASTSTLDSLVLNVLGGSTDASPIPTVDTDVSYILEIETDNAIATITANTSFGVLYGLETFSQLVNSKGMIAGDGITITDAPEFRHRGLTIDVGRRFAPIKLINSIIDGLSYTKMNVLHM